MTYRLKNCKPLILLGLMDGMLQTRYKHMASHYSSPYLRITLFIYTIQEIILKVFNIKSYFFINANHCLFDNLYSCLKYICLFSLYHTNKSFYFMIYRLIFFIISLFIFHLVKLYFSLMHS